MSGHSLGARLLGASALLLPLFLGVAGYGLDVETELKQLRVARQLGETRDVTVRTTFLGAHALPAEFAERSDDYIEFVCSESLPAAARAGLADAVDAFCESIAFSPDQTARVFDKAKALGLPVKLHADQLSDLGGAALAAGYGVGRMIWAHSTRKWNERVQRLLTAMTRTAEEATPLPPSGAEEGGPTTLPPPDTSGQYPT